MHQVTIHQAEKQILDLIKVAIAGVEVVITNDDQPIAKIVSAQQPKPTPKAKPTFGSAKGLITIADDFDDPLDDLGDDSSLPR